MPRFSAMPPAMIASTPPFALAATPFRFRALASLAGRAPLGGEREIVLACYVVGRLVAGLLPPYRLSTETIRARAGLVRSWLGAHALAANCRTACSNVIEAVIAGDLSAVHAALVELTTVAGPHLDTLARYSGLRRDGRADSRAWRLAPKPNSPLITPWVVTARSDPSAVNYSTGKELNNTADSGSEHYITT
jgi:hypothetical protein